MSNQNLFEALERVCNFIATEDEMSEIINAHKQDLEKIIIIPKPPKVVIAVIDGCFTKGKKYNVVRIAEFPYNYLNGYGFFVVDNKGLEQYCVEKKCSHMDEGDWIIKEREL